MSSNPDVLRKIEDLEWREVFFDQRDEFCATTRVVVFGHGVLDDLHAPFIGLMAKAILLEFASDSQPPVDQLDALVAGDLSRHLASLRPLPLLGVPGFWPDQTRTFYDSHPRYFRRQRTRG